MNSIERSGWDLKFQNYWGYTIAAEGNEKMAQALCMRLFAHIGLFRDEATKHFRQIVDSLHLPDSELKPEKYNEDTIQDAGVFDEHDNRLYTGEERSQGSTLNKLNFNMVEQNVFLHNNIFYKVTNLNEQLIMSRVKTSDPYDVDDFVSRTVQDLTQKSSNKFIAPKDKRSVEKWKVYGK